MSKYYSTPGAQHSGSVSDLRGLARYQVVLYAQANIYGLTATASVILHVCTTLDRLQLRLP